MTSHLIVGLQSIARIVGLSEEETLKRILSHEIPHVLSGATPVCDRTILEKVMTSGHWNRHRAGDRLA